MRKLFFIILSIFLAQIVFASPLLIGQKVVYRGTVNNMRISAVDGTAFIDNLPYTYSSDFSAGVDGWIETRGTVAGNIDSIGGEDNWLRYTANTELGAHYTRTTPLLTVGRRYIVSVKYYIPSGQTVIAGILFSTGSVTYLPAGITYQNTLDAATTYTASFVATNEELRFYATDAAGSITIQDAGGDDVFYIKDITISEITPYADGNHQIEIYDASNRMLRGVLKAAGSGVTTNTVYTADFSAGLDEWSVSWATGYEVGSFLWDTDHTVLTVAGNSYLVSRPLLAKTLSMTVGALQFMEMDYSVVSGTAVITGETVGGVYQSLINTLSGTDTYITSQQTCAGTFYNKLYLYFNGKDYDFVLNINAMRVKAITAPSSSGATIVSAKGGTTYNFGYKNPTFTYNAASYYVVIKALR
jgi:hypothetical protein